MHRLTSFFVDIAKVKNGYVITVADEKKQGKDTYVALSKKDGLEIINKHCFYDIKDEKQHS